MMIKGLITFDKAELIKRAKEKSTWVGLAGLAIAYFGLPNGSGEQITGLIVSLVSFIWPEKPEDQA